MSSATKLTINDATVLDRLFDPEASPHQGAVIDPSLSPDPHIRDSTLLAQLQQRELSIVKQVEQALQASDRDAEDIERTLNTAISDLAAIISVHPAYASAYVNRAQCNRLVQSNTTSTKAAPTLLSILADLDTAINLSKPTNPTDPVSPATAKTLASAYTQRGTLYLTTARPKPSTPNPNSTTGKDSFTCETTSTTPRHDLEEKASSDFSLGARYGNQFARSMAVRTNPYAKACGNIVRQALMKEHNGGALA